MKNSIFKRSLQNQKVKKIRKTLKLQTQSVTDNILKLEYKMQARSHEKKISSFNLTYTYQKIIQHSYNGLRMLRQTRRKRHLISSPPQKWPFFFGGGGGVIFLEYFHEFLGLGHKKNFGKTLGKSRCFGIIIGQFRPLPAIL